MTEPRWVVLDHRERANGGWTVYHWRGAGVTCLDSGRAMPLSIFVARCADHLDRDQECMVIREWPSRCPHTSVVLVAEAPVCTECWMVGQDVTAEMGA